MVLFQAVQCWRLLVEMVVMVLWEEEEGELLKNEEIWNTFA